MTQPIPFDDIGRLPAPDDNVAIAIKRLEAGTRIVKAGEILTLSHTVLEGHRFAVKPVAAGESLLSWGLPFGQATRSIAPGDYACNDSIIAALHQRHVNFPLPDTGNFKNQFAKFTLDETTFQAGRQVEPAPEPATFAGYSRGPERGAGTRNSIIILGTTSLTASFCRKLAERFQNTRTDFPNIDGVVAVTHTEGGGQTRPTNLDFILRTLAGFMVNPNVGAVLAVDFGTEVVTNAMVREFMLANGYPLAGVPHHFFSLRGEYQTALGEAEQIVRGWLEPVNACQRSPQPLRHLRLGLQCGGSDAFSGISGNPVVGLMSQELVRHGGSANLAETDELIGAEPYVLANVRDYATARAFLDQLNRFQERAGWHGSSAEGNPSGGNMFRGLYNIAIKSIGAARKKDPATRLDYVIDYSQRMADPGFYFMDSPGNDLESIAGQVAAGCNVIVFTTGNGSITNFPFVPTIKVMTNTGRFNLLHREMDLNAGRYLDGVPMEALGREAFDYLLKIASGEKSVGERAGHAQVQMWREWRQTDGSHLQALLHASPPPGEPLPLRASFQPDHEAANRKFEAWVNPRGAACDRIGLILPTSLCSSQIGRMIADKLNREAGSSGSSLQRFVALGHTEGCGVSEESDRVHLQTMSGYLCHPFIGRALLLEHGCEKTHNDAFRNFLADQGIDASGLGWASIQLDGGIEKVTDKVVGWFQQTGAGAATTKVAVNVAQLCVGFTSLGKIPDAVAKTVAKLAGAIASLGGKAIVPRNATLLASDAFQAELFEAPAVTPTLGYGVPARAPGFHIMDTPTDHHVETITGLGAAGAELILAFVAGPPAQGHPLVPLLQITTSDNPYASGASAADWDLVWDETMHEGAAGSDALWSLVQKTAARTYTPRLLAQGNHDFQITRGWLGVSL